MMEPGDGAEVRPVSPADAAVIAALHGDIFGDRPWGPTAVAEVLAMPGAFGFLAVDAGAPTGFVLARVAAGEGEILSIGVAARRRRRGIGTALLTAALVAAGDRGCRAVYLEVAADDPGAGGLYAAAGFRPCGRRPAYYPRDGAPAAPAVVMRRDLG